MSHIAENIGLSILGGLAAVIGFISIGLLVGLAIKACLWVIG